MNCTICKTKSFFFLFIFIIFFFFRSAYSQEIIGDINGDLEIGLEEAVYALKVVAGINPDYYNCPGDDENAGIYHICNYFPLTAGNFWKYTTGERFVVNEKYTNNSDLTGIRLGTYTYEYEPFLVQTENGIDALAQYENPEGTLFQFNPSLSIFPAEMHIGETSNGTYTWPDSSNTTFANTLVGKEQLTVPAGTFETLKFKIEINDVGECQYTTWIWLAKNIGIIKIHRTDPDPSDCSGCLFVCRPDNDLSKVNAPAELISAAVNGSVYKRESYNMIFYYPLSVGNLWNYDDGKMEVVSQSNNAYYVLDTGACEDGNQPIFTNDENGLQIVGASEFTFSAPLKIANKYAKIGDELISNLTIIEESLNIQANSRFVGIENIAVPAGYFKGCLKFSLEISVGQTNDDYHKTYLWFSKDVGIVKMQRYEFQPPQSQGCILCQNERNLIGYSLK